eukprot:m51a1_g273 hypothetical protein (471) ;mRNA; f:260688-263468
MEHEQRTMSMWLQTLPRKGFVAIFVAFGVLFGLSIIVGAVGPSIYTRHTYSAWNCNTTNGTAPSEFDPALCTGVMLSDPGQQWDGVLSGMSKLNQQIRLLVAPANNFTEGITADVVFSIMVTGRRSGETEAVVVLNHTREREVTCPKNRFWCKGLYLVQLPHVEYDDYEFRVGVVKAPSTGWVHDFRFTFEYVTSDYTLFELWFRFFFLLATFAMIAFQVVYLRKYRWSDWAIEQHWTSILLFCLLGYNNPFYPCTVLFGGWFWIFVNELLTSTFVIMLLLYWLIVFHGVRPSAQRMSRFKFYVPKFVFLGACGILTIILITWAKMYQVDNPTHDSVTDLTSYLFLTAAMLLLIIIYVFWMVYLVFRSCGDIKGMNFLGSRIKFFAVYTLLCMAVVVIGYTAAFLSPASNNAARFLSMIAMANLYLYVLSVMYLPSSEAKSWLEGRSGLARLAETHDDVSMTAVPTDDRH